MAGNLKFKIEARNYKRCLVIYKKKSRRLCALFVPCLYRIVHFSNPYVHSALNCGLNARWSLGPRCLVVVRSCKVVQNCKHYQMLITTSYFFFRHLCLLLSSEDIYRTLAEILLEENDLKFAALMVKTLNIILLTSSELFELRHKLKELKTKVG